MGSSASQARIEARLLKAARHTTSKGSTGVGPASGGVCAAAAPGVSGERKPALSHERGLPAALISRAMDTPSAPPEYQPETLTRAEVDASPGALLLDFGTGWCGHCRAARPLVQAAWQAHASAGGQVRHVRVEDGSGRRLGRSYGVKLWPTLVFLRDGVERARLVRPQSVQDVAAALRAIDPPPLSAPA